MKVNVLAKLSGSLLRDFFKNLTDKTTASDWEIFIEENQKIGDENIKVEDFQPEIIETFFLIYLNSPQEQKDALVNSIPNETIIGLVLNIMMTIVLRNPDLLLAKKNLASELERLDVVNNQNHTTGSQLIVVGPSGKMDQIDTSSMTQQDLDNLLNDTLGRK